MRLSAPTIRFEVLLVDCHEAQFYYYWGTCTP